MQRWTIEEAFRQLTQYLCCEVRTLGYPKAALFAFTLAVLAYNTLTCVKAALKTNQRQDPEHWSTFYMAWEVKVSFDGMMVAVPEEEWQPFATMSPQAFATFLRRVAGWLAPYFWSSGNVVPWISL